MTVKVAVSRDPAVTSSAASGTTQALPASTESDRSFSATGIATSLNQFSRSIRGAA